MSWSPPMLSLATNTYWGNHWFSAPLRLTCQFASQLLRLWSLRRSCSVISFLPKFKSFSRSSTVMNVMYFIISYFFYHHIEWMQIKGNSHYVVCRPSHISYNFWLSSDRIWVVISIKNHFYRFSLSFTYPDS